MTRAGRRRPIKRPNRRDDEITIAGLTGAAVFLAGERGDRDAAVAELAASATQPDPDTGRSRVRAELLEEAAGYNLASWQHDAHGHWLGRDAALLLVDAGANAERVKAIAAERLPDFQTREPPGIGNPTRGRRVSESRPSSRQEDSR